MSHTGKAWQEGRRRALKRDGYQCQDCGRKDESVHAHHIQRPEVFDSDEAAHHESNLVALCKYCHPDWEGVDARPILLDGAGTNLRDVAPQLSFETIRRLSLEYSRGLYEMLILRDGEVCQECCKQVPKPGGKPPYKPAQKFDEMLWRVIDGEEYERVIPPRERGTRKCFCDQCNGRVKEILSAEDLTESMHHIVARIRGRDIPFDKDVAYGTVRRMKSDPARTHTPGDEILTKAATRGIRGAMMKRQLDV